MDSNLIGAINDLAAEKAKFKDKEKDLANKVLKALKNMMGNNPDVVAIRWNQYTPHFNDGDACMFGVNDLDLKFREGLLKVEQDGNGDDDDFIYGWDIDDDWFEEKSDIMNHKDIRALKKTVTNLNDAFNVLKDSMEDSMLNLFGDGVQVTVTATGVDVEEYAHD